jgi:hypothetical protein
MKAEKLVRIEGDSNQWSVAITRQTIQRIISHPNPKAKTGDMIALWMFYAYTARWQEVNQPKATTSYTAKGLRWSQERVKKTKNLLKGLGLIEDAVRKDASGKVVGWYIRVFHLASSHSTENPGGGEHGDKCSRSIRLNAQGKKSEESEGTVSLKPRFFSVLKAKQEAGGTEIGKRASSKQRGVSSQMKPRLSFKEREDCSAAPQSSAPTKVSHAGQRAALADFPEPHPDSIPSRLEFDEFLSENMLFSVLEHRPQIYEELTSTKWARWCSKSLRWKRIRNWKNFIYGLDSKILSSESGLS